MKKLLVVLLVLGFAAPAAAVQWDLSASIRTHAGYYDVDQEYSSLDPALSGPKMDGTIGDFEGDDDSGFLMGLDHNSTFTARAMVSENFYGVVQLGPQDSLRDEFENTDTYLRLAYGVWNFGAGKLTLGKDYTPATYTGYSRMSGDIGGGGSGNFLGSALPYIARQPQIKLSFGDLDIAFIEQNKDADGLDSLPQQFDATEAPGFLDGDFYTGNPTIGEEEFDTDKDFSLPRIEVAYVFRTDLVNIRPVLGYQTYEVEGLPGGSEDIDSFVAGIGASFDLSPFYVKTVASYVQNPSNYGHSSVGSVANRGATLGLDGKLHDADLYQGTLVAGMQVNKMLNLETGFAYMNSQVDHGFTDLSSFIDGVDDPVNMGSKDLEQEAYIYYLQAWFTLSKNVHIIPEIGMVDRKDLEWEWEQPVLDAYGNMDGISEGTQEQDLGKMTYATVVFRLDF